MHKLSLAALCAAASSWRRNWCGDSDWNSGHWCNSIQTTNSPWLVSRHRGYNKGNESKSDERKPGHVAVYGRNIWCVRRFFAAKVQVLCCFVQFCGVRCDKSQIFRKACAFVLRNKHSRICLCKSRFFYLAGTVNRVCATKYRDQKMIFFVKHFAKHRAQRVNCLVLYTRTSTEMGSTWAIISSFERTTATVGYLALLITHHLSTISLSNSSKKNTYRIIYMVFIE